MKEISSQLEVNSYKNLHNKSVQKKKITIKVEVPSYFKCLTLEVRALFVKPQKNINPKNYN